MARRSRADQPGAWHHITNRGIAKRPLFEDRQDVRYFLASLAKEVRRGSIEVHSFSVLTTHYHGLIRSVAGQLSSAMQRAGLRYSRYFNRRYRRDGSLVRGRFSSKRVCSLRYRRNVVRYIDNNPVDARLVEHPWDYPFGSAASYFHGQEPPWLSTNWIKAEVMRPPEWEGFVEDRAYTGMAYIERFGGRYSAHMRELVERRLACGDSGPDELDSLIGAAPPRVLAWMQRKARLADGGRVREPLVVQAAVDASLLSWPPSVDQAVNSGSRRPISSQVVVRVGLLRSMAALTWSEIAQRANLPQSTCRRLCERHQSLLLHEPAYAAASSACAQRAIQITFGVTIKGARGR